MSAVAGTVAALAFVWGFGPWERLIAWLWWLAAVATAVAVGACVLRWPSLPSVAGGRWGWRVAGTVVVAGALIVLAATAG